MGIPAQEPSFPILYFTTKEEEKYSECYVLPLQFSVLLWCSASKFIDAYNLL